MSTFRIVNITDQLGKRDVNYKSTLKIDYVDGMNRKALMVKPNETTYLTVSSLPLSLHRMRIKSWVKVDEISQKELKKEIAKSKRRTAPKPAPVKKGRPKNVVETKTTTKKPKTTMKKTPVKAEKE